MLSKNTRSASVIRIGGFRPSGNPLTTHFGLCPLANPSESWPTYLDNEMKQRPMFFVCQLNLTEATYVPPILNDIKLITFFIEPDKIDAKNWCIRAYKTLENLVPLKADKKMTFQKGFEAKWELVQDQPTFDDPDLVLPEGRSLKDPEITEFLKNLTNVSGSKIGGYSTNIQSQPWWDNSDHPAKPKFCIQIDTEGKVDLSWGDRGIFYIARGTSLGHTDEWFADCQSL